MKLYDEINIKGFDCYYIGTKNNKDMFLLKDVLNEEQIKKYTNNDEIMIFGNEVRFDDNLRTTTWEETYLKRVLCKNMEEDLDCEVDILSKKEVEELPDKIKYIDKCYWTSSRYSSNYAWYVDTTDGSNNLTSTFAVRPVLYLESDNQKSKKIKKIFHCYIETDNKETKFLIQNINGLSDKLNEIIDKINEMSDKNE